MFVWSSFVAIDVFLKSFTIVSTHHVACETGFKQDSPNLIQIQIHYMYVSESRFFNRISP